MGFAGGFKALPASLRAVLASRIKKFLISEMLSSPLGSVPRSFKRHTAYEKKSVKLRIRQSLDKSRRRGARKKFISTRWGVDVGRLEEMTLIALPTILSFEKFLIKFATPSSPQTSPAFKYI